MASAQSPNSRGPLEGGFARWQVWVTEEQQRGPLRRRSYTVHALMGGQEQTMRFYAKGEADRVAAEAARLSFQHFDLRTAYSNIYHE